PYSTLAAALAASSNGDRIVIAGGTYAGGISISKSVSIRGEGPGETILGLSGTPGVGSVVTIAEGAEVTISDLTITGGFAQLGGGVNNLGELTLNDSVVTGNNGFGFGSAGTIYNGPSSELVLSDTTVSNNVVVDG